MELEKLEKWCQDGITMLSSPNDIPRLVELRRKTVTHFARSRKLYEVAADIADGLNDLPEDARKIAREYLLSTYGFSFEFFMDRGSAKVRAILKRGRVRNKAEFRALSDFLTDNE
ncbi:hypothetical protein I5U23_23570, partial [Stenotrophomonas maltophilia]|nr:hypothetical protein [Stenotrophomonas maltophilia]